MSDEEDVDLLALQRTLDDAFETTRPRRGFEDELWLRMQSRRPFWRRLQDGLAGLVAGVMEAPAVPAAAVAVVLVVAVGVGIFSLSGLNASHPTSAGMASRALPGGSALSASGAFGRLPAPTAHTRPGYDATPPQPVGTAPDQGQGFAPAVPTNLYFGPANLSFTGHLNVTSSQAMVFRYSEPAGAAATQFATSLGAAAQTGTPAPGYLGTFAGRDFTVSVTASTETPVREPFFFLTPTASSTYAAQAAPSQVAGDFLASHSLAPMWPNVVSTVQVGDQATVRYLREFVAPDGGFAYLVDGLGSRYGLEVDLKGGQPVIAAGPLPLALDSAEYPIISAADAVRMALDSSAAGAAAVSPMPTVQLTSAELVYALAWSGGHGFYEPCFLFSGTFTANGVTYVKRVLVPAVAH